MKKIDHEKYMTESLKQAKKAFAKDEVPIGAVVVDKCGKIIGRGYNRMEKIKCQTGHAEIIAIKKACKKIGDWRLNDCWIYVTLEPCPMCIGLIRLSRIEGLVFGLESPLFGFGYKNNKSLPTLKKDLVIKDGVKSAESLELMKKFFKNIRSPNKK